MWWIVTAVIGAITIGSLYLCWLAMRTLFKILFEGPYYD